MMIPLTDCFGGDDKMTNTKTQRKKNNEKLYKKIRNTSSLGSTVVYLLMIILFIAMLVVLAGFVLQYFVETKYAEGYSEIEHTARLYEMGSDDKKVMEYIESGDSDFYVTDQNGKIIYRKGKDTRTDTSGKVSFLNGEESYTLYIDSETDFLYVDNDSNLRLSVGKFIEWFTDVADDEDAKVPVWVNISLSGGRKLVGKMYFIITKRDTILVVELMSAFLAIVIVFCVLAFVRIIRSVVNYRRVVRLFYSDPTTGGHNWNWYVRYGDERLNSFRSKKDSFAVVNIVFRNYRNYCLCHSMAEGEDLLAEINYQLSQELGKGEMCAHATMSNFAMLLKYKSEQQLRERLDGFIEKLRGIESEHNFDFQIGADLIPPKVNDGGKIVRRKGRSVENAYNNACAARAELGETEESGVRIFDNALFEQQRWRDIVQQHQYNALKNEEFVVYYQPKYDPRTNALKGAEALVRWDSPEFGFVTPGRIIPIFEKNGFITEIDHYMLKHVARDQKAWLDEGYECVPVSVNVSRAHFIETDLAQQIRDIVDAAQCPHGLIEIELTESAFFDDKKAMIATIRKLKEYGFAVSMDDFGAGYSSLNSLKDMPLDVLKLDADFFRGENAGQRGEIVVSEAIRLAKSLDMRTVAEGIEQKDQVDFLAQQGCDMIQGYYFAKPMPKNEYTEKMSRSDSAQNDAHTEMQ